MSSGRGEKALSPVVRKRVPRAVEGACAQIGGNIQTWRRLRNMSVSDLANRSGVSAATLRRLEQGHGASLENVLRVVRQLGVMDPMVASTDPWNDDRGQILMAAMVQDRGRR